MYKKVSELILELQKLPKDAVLVEEECSFTHKGEYNFHSPMLVNKDKKEYSIFTIGIFEGEYDECI